MQQCIRTMIIVSAALICFQVQAQTKAEPQAAAVPGQPAATGAGESNVKIEEVSGQKNKVAGDLDKEISNPKLRADSGSKSKYSMSTGLNYRGGSVQRPFGNERPNLLGTPEQQVDTSLDANIRARYRTTKNESYTFGASLGFKTPFHGDVNANENQLNVGDPVIGYNRTWAGLGLQNSWNINAAAGATDESKNVDLVASLATDYTLMKKFDKFQLGIQGVFFHQFYDSGAGDNKLTRKKAGSEKHDSRIEYQLAFNPTVEYYVNDRFSVRALFSYFRWTNLYGDDQNWRLLRNKEYNSLGVGIVATRNVYLYPNVQFLPRDIRSDYTNFAMSASMNLF